MKELAADVDVAVLDVSSDEERSRRLVRNRTLGARLRGALGSGGDVRVEREVCWPLALVYASATGQTLRGKPWTARVAGAVDLVTGRPGIVDVDLPPVHPRTVPSEDRVPRRHDDAQVHRLWREFFRDYIVRRHRPLRPPALAVDRLEHVWLPYHVVMAGGRRFLVDLLTRRVDPLDAYPEVLAVVQRPAGERTKE